MKSIKPDGVEYIVIWLSVGSWRTLQRSASIVPSHRAVSGHPEPSWYLRAVAGRQETTVHHVHACNERRRNGGRAQVTGLRQADELRPERQPALSSLRCQWCSVTLPEGTVVCPTCSSPGVPDPAMTAAGSEILEPLPSSEAVRPPEELDEWWLDDVAAPRPAARPESSVALDEDRLLKTAAILIGIAAVCAFIGWLAGPLLAPAMENITGSPVQDTNDLRPMGSIFGFVAGLFIGACAGWISQA